MATRIEFAVESVVAQGAGRTQNDEFEAGAGDGDVHAAQVGKKTNLSRFVGTNQRDENDVALLSLKSIDGVDGNL